MSHWYHFGRPIYGKFTIDGKYERVNVLAWRPIIDEEDASDPFDVMGIQYLTDMAEVISYPSEIEWE